MEIQGDIDIFVGNNTIIDMELYELWLKRMSASDAAKHLKTKNRKAAYDLLMSDVLDQYRTLGFMEKYLKIPLSLGNQLSFQLTQEMQRELIIRYYSFDSAVIRELLGKKLSRSTCQNMDEVADKTGINLRSCLRQFDNCRRVFKAVEEMPGSLIENIEQQFLIPRDLSWAYATVVFLANHKFECTKRKLSHMSLNNFITCTQQLIENWSCGSDSECLTTDMNVDIDREFLHDLRGVKFLALDKEIPEKCRDAIFDSIQTKACEDLESTCKYLSRSIATIASGIYHTKDLRDLFVDIVEKVVEPVRIAKWPYSLMQEFMVHYVEITNKHPQMLVYRSTWTRFLNALNCCIMQSYY